MQRSKMRSAALAVFFAFFCGMVGAGSALAVQDHMVAARADLNSALHELNQATANKGGHRNNAMRLVSQAINEVNLGIQYAR